MIFADERDAIAEARREGLTERHYAGSAGSSEPPAGHYALERVPGGVRLLLPEPGAEPTTPEPAPAVVKLGGGDGLMRTPPAPEIHPRAAATAPEAPAACESTPSEVQPEGGQSERATERAAVRSRREDRTTRTKKAPRADAADFAAAANRVLARCEESGDCLLVQTASKAEHVPVKVAGRKVDAHRLLWEHYHGREPEGDVVRTCGHRRCVAEAHLRHVSRQRRMQELAAGGVG